MVMRPTAAASWFPYRSASVICGFDGILAADDTAIGCRTGGLLLVPSLGGIAGSKSSGAIHDEVGMIGGNHGIIAKSSVG
jgi:hypothetical protein